MYPGFFVVRCCNFEWGEWMDDGRMRMDLYTPYMYVYARHGLEAYGWVGR